MLAPARIPVAEGKKMENISKKFSFEPGQLGTKFSAKMSAVEHNPRMLWDIIHQYSLYVSI